MLDAGCFCSFKRRLACFHQVAYVDAEDPTRSSFCRYINHDARHHNCVARINTSRCVGGMRVASGLGIVLNPAEACVLRGACEGGMRVVSG